MNTTKLLTGTFALFLALVAMPAALANTYHRESIGPTTVNIDQVGEFGISLCDDDLGAIVPAILCGSGGVGAIIDISDLNPADFASGSCTVTQDSPIVSQTNGDFSFSCGVDRDDDGLVTNVVDNDDSSDSVSVSGPLGSGTAAVCFRSDLNGAAAIGQDGQFDTMAVFIAVNVPSTSVAVGTFDVDVSLTGVASCTPSGHNGGGGGVAGDCNGLIDITCNEPPACVLWSDVLGCIVGG